MNATVWRFDDAPKELRDLSTNGGDEDWIVELPKSFHQYGAPSWVEGIAACRDPNEYPHPTKPDYVVYIGSHA